MVKENLIILHGWQSSSEKWEEVKTKLEGEKLNIFIPDLPGFKSETKLEKVWDLDDYVNWVENFLTEQKKNFPELKKGFFLLGHSFGGRIIIKMSSQKRDDLKGIILVSAAGIKRNQFYKKALKRGAYYVKKLHLKEFPILKYPYNFFRKCFYRVFLRKTDYFDTNGFLRGTIQNILEEDLFGLLKKIKIKTKIIWGNQDFITPIEDAYLMKREIENSELKFLEGVGHTPHLVSPNKLAEEIKNFIN